MEEQTTQLPLLATPSNSKVVFIDTISALNEAVKQLQRESGWFAVDAERASGFKYSNRAYLVQISRGESPLFLIDPFAIDPDLQVTPFAELANVMLDDTWILHAATQDLPCLAEIGLKPTSLFDTELAGRLLGLPRVGLGSMVEAFLGLRLAKEHSAVDWSTRPLHSEWLNYAALDIDVLHELSKQVQLALVQTDKLQFALEDFAALVNFKPKPPKTDKWRSTTGLHEVKNQIGLSVAKELWLAREQLAAKLDVSPGRIVPDSSISAVAKELPRSRPELVNQKTFIGRGSRSYIDTWWDAVHRGLTSNDMPPIKQALSGIPNHRNWAQRFPAAEARLQALKPVVATLSQELNMPTENLLTPDHMRSLAWQPPEKLAEIDQFLISLGARRWQAELVSSGFRDALEKLDQEQP